jgi:hypothetical protein
MRLKADVILWKQFAENRNAKIKTLPGPVTKEGGDAMRKMSEMVEPVDACTVLEEEFKHLHGELGPDFPHNGTADERVKKLNERVHALKNDEKRSALCFSGGGIRSATFCLGVLQGLAKRKQLGQFHYLSTVSGGGYIGSWLSSWIHRTNLTSVLQGLAAPQTGKAPEPEPIRRLRAYSNYLSPVWGISTDFLTLVSTFLRNLLLQWSVFLPLLAAVLMLPRIYLGALAWNPSDIICLYLFLAIAASLVAVGIAYVVADLPGSVGKNKPANKFPVFCFLPILCAALLLSWIGIRYSNILHGWHWGWFLGGGALVHLTGVAAGLVWRRARGITLEHEKGNVADALFILLSGAVGGGLLYLAGDLFKKLCAASECRELYATVSVPALLCSFWLGTTVYTGLSRRVASEDDREWWARSGAWWLGASAVWVVGFVLVIYCPQWIFNIPWFSKRSESQALGLGVGGGVLGIITGLIGYWSKNGSMLKQRAKGIAAATGLRLLDLAALMFTVFLLLTLSYALSLGLTCMKSDLKAETRKIFDTSRTVASKPDREPKQIMAAPVPEANTKETPESAVKETAIAAEPTAHAADPAAANMQRLPTAQKSAVSEAYVHVLENSGILTPTLLALALLVIGIGMSFFIGVNTFSLNSMYGNRLVRAYLGATRTTRHPHWFTGFDPADNLSMKDLIVFEKRLFHVVNMALNQVRPSGQRLEWQQRKASSFTVSPLYAGGASVGYLQTSTYSGENGVSLGRAMTISGAAASPNMGYHTSSLVAFVMTFFNIRLGWWLPNPGPRWRTEWRRSEPSLGVRALMAEALAQTTDDSPYVNLSDGGHFENLALYEMVKRRCSRIVVVDAGCDPKYGFEDLENAIRKIRIDLGISIVFPEGLPTPEKARASGRRIATGIIRYSDVDGQVEEGHIVYIKPVLSGDEPLDVLRYGAANKDPKSPFPHQSTADQFFDESQFESYRMLGYHSVLTGFPADGGWPVHGRLGDKGPEQTSASAESKKDTRTLEAGDGMISGVSNALQSLGQGALLATAITVGGVVGVAGTLTLQPGAEIGFTEQDRQLLKDGLPLKVSGLPEAVSAALSNGLTVTVNSPSVMDTTSLEKKLVLLEKYLLVSFPTVSELMMIRQEINTIRTALVDEKGELKTGSIGTKLDGLRAELGDINESVKKTDPRRNVRGVGEGGAR